MQNVSEHKSTGKERAKELRAKIDDSLDTLAKAVDDVRASEMFQRYLEVQARFHHYSWHNCMLIGMQRPDATQVAGFKAWQKLGRHVCKGERGIMIFAPRPWKREREAGNGDTEIDEGISFRPVYVFDVGQTDGEELPRVDVPTIDNAAEDLLADLVRVAGNRGLTVNIAPIDDGPFGLTDGKKIDVNSRHATGQQAKTLAHELAHAALHFNSDRESLTRSIAELEAESVAYVVCTHVGLDVEIRSSRYIALWDGDAKALRASLERIAGTARTLIDELEALEPVKAVA